jgi:hypothetical protein
MMTLGGNLRLKKHFGDYDLLEIPAQDRYLTVAADFYRCQLKSQMEGEAILEEPPSKEAGQKVMEQTLRTSAEIMANNPAFSSSGSNNEAYDDLSMSKMFWEGLSSVKETGSYIASQVNETLESTGAKEKFSQVTT